MLNVIMPLIGFIGLIALIVWVRSLPPYEGSDEHKAEVKAEEERFKRYYEGEQQRKQHERQLLAREIVAEMKRQGMKNG